VAKVLILHVHPAVEQSRANAALRAAVKGLPGVSLRDLYEIYPDFFIDVAQEQSLLLNHDVLVFQHPFYWYSCPPLLKEWMDRVLEYGFAYGDDGDKLRGKHFQQVITSAGSEARYQSDGLNHFTIPQLLRPFEQSAHLCGLITHAPWIMHGARRLSDEQLEDYGRSYADLITQYVTDRFPPVSNSFGGA